VETSDELSRGKQRLLRRLSETRGREKEGLVILEGRRVVEAGLEFGARFRFALLAHDGASEEVELAHRLDLEPTELVRVDRDTLAEFADTRTPQGILAVAEEPVEAFPPEKHPEIERILVLDAVQDPGNVGTLIRSAAALEVDRVLLFHGTADPWNAKTVRASAGFGFSLPLHRIGIEEGLAWLDSEGIPLLVADADGLDVRRSAGLPSAQASFALLLGNEGAGPRMESLEAARIRVALPMRPGVESLNVAVAGSILLWALGPARQGPENRPEPPSPRSEGSPPGD
jgi:RNA methyltransferase, TrmH family